MEAPGTSVTSVDLNQTACVRSQQTSPKDTSEASQALTVLGTVRMCRHDIRYFEGAVGVRQMCVGPQQDPHGTPLTIVHGCYQGAL